MSSSSSLFLRASAWLLVAATGNIAVAFLILVAWQSPLEIPVAESLEFFHTFVGPMFAPTLLIFTSAPSLLVALTKRAQADDDTDANRLIARAVQFALTFVLSFAALMIVAEPTSLANVLFAALLGFVTFVLADRLAPPVALSAEEKYRKAAADRARREAWAANAAGIDLTADDAKRVWPAIVAFAFAPVVVTTAVGVAYASLVWGTDWAFSGTTITMMAVSGYGAAVLALAWLSMADKADSPSARAWRGGTFIFYGVLASVAFAAVFFAAGPEAGGVGWLILCVTAAQAAVLWLPFPWAGRTVLRGIAARVTTRHLIRIRTVLDSAHQVWVDELAETRMSTRFWKRLCETLGLSRPSRKISGPLTPAR